MVWDGQLQLRQMQTIGSDYVGIYYLCHMQHHTIVGRVRVMTMTLPVAGTKVQLYITHPQCVTYANLGIEEIRTRMRIGQPGVDDFQRLAVGGVHGFQWEQTMFPHVMQ